MIFMYVSFDVFVCQVCHIVKLVSEGTRMCRSAGVCTNAHVHMYMHMYTCRVISQYS
jgi:hypothetical protein